MAGKGATVSIGSSGSLGSDILNMNNVIIRANLGETSPNEDVLTFLYRRTNGSI